MSRYEVSLQLDNNQPYPYHDRIIVKRTDYRDALAYVFTLYLEHGITSK